MTRSYKCDRCGELVDEPAVTLKEREEYLCDGVEPTDQHFCEKCAQWAGSEYFAILQDADRAAHLIPWERLFENHFGWGAIPKTDLGDKISEITGSTRYAGDKAVSAALEADHLEETEGGITLSD